MRSATALALLLALPVPVPVAAQDCVIPAGIRPAPAARYDPRDRVAAPITHHLLALSWSPEFCRFRRDEPAQRMQCGRNRFGFVVHGLWPEGPGRYDPRDCAPAPPLDAATVGMHLCMMPGAALIQQQWATHGSCGWRSGAAYLDATARLWRGLRLPDVSAATTAGAVRDAFVRANPGLPRAAIVVETNRRGWLREVRLCYPRELSRPIACPDGRTGAPDRISVKVERR